MDSEPIVVHSTTPDNLISIVNDMVSNIQFKFIGLMVIIFIMLSSDVFINRVLGTFPNAVDAKTPTSWGVTLQAAFLAIGMIGTDAMIRQKII